MGTPGTPQRLDASRRSKDRSHVSIQLLVCFNPVKNGRAGDAPPALIYTNKYRDGGARDIGQGTLPALLTPLPHPAANSARPWRSGVLAEGSGVLAEMAAAGGAVGAGLQPLHDVLQVATVAAALAPDEEPLHHVVTHGTHAGTLPTPAQGNSGGRGQGEPSGGSRREQGHPPHAPVPTSPSGPPHLSQIQPLLLMGRLQLLQLTWRVVEAWLRQLMARQVLSLITSLEMFQSWNRCSRSM